MDDPGFETKFVNHLPYDAARKLSDMLNTGDFSICRDWRAFAGALDLSLQEVQSLERDQNPALAVIKKWEKKHNLFMTVGTLFDCLRNIGRKDILSELQGYVAAMPTSEEYNMTQRDIKEASCAQPEMTLLPYYDAMISFARADADIAREISTKLAQTPYCYKICFPDHDFLPGFHADEQTIEVMEKRCRKVIAILTSNYANCPECDFQAKVALNLCKGAGKHKVIPIRYDTSDVPKVLQGITSINYFDKDYREYFWQKLDRALKVMSP